MTERICYSDHTLEDGTHMLRLNETSFEDLCSYLHPYYGIFIGGFLSILGSVFNVINFAVFFKQGLQDMVNGTYFTLSLVNLGICFTSLLSSLCSLIETYFPLASLNFLDVQYVYVDTALELLVLLARMVNVHLCAILYVFIKWPIKGKIMFTKSRFLLLNVFTVSFTVACFSPLPATQGLAWAFDLDFNRTRLKIWSSSNRQEIRIFMERFFSVSLLPVIQFIALLTVITLLLTIKTSYTFRLKHTTKNVKKKMASDLSGGTVIDVPTTVGKRTKRDKVPCLKYLKLAKILVILTILHSLIYTVYIVAVLGDIMGNETREFRCGSYTVQYFVTRICTLSNCITLIFCLYFVSSRYRTTFDLLFCRAG